MIRQTVTILTVNGPETVNDVQEVEIDEGALYLRSPGRTVVFAAGGWLRSETVPA